MSPSRALSRKTLMLAGILIPLVAIFLAVTFRSGPFASVPVTVVTVESRSVSPSLFGIGIVEARYTHKLGPTFTGRLRGVEVEPGARVTRGQLLGEMDPIDLDDKIVAQDAAIKRAEASVTASKARIEELAAREDFAEAQARRYKQISAPAVSADDIEASAMELRVAQMASRAARANHEVALQDLARLQAERDGLQQQRANLRFFSPVDGLVTRREADIGTTVVAGQPVVEIVEPEHIWLNVRFDQQTASGLQSQRPVQIVLRSLGDTPQAGHVLRIEPHADAVTEEILAKVMFDTIPDTLPPIGELAEVTVALEARKPMPAVPNASIHRINGTLGVWVVKNGGLRFVPVKSGAADLDGWIQILEGIKEGDRVVVHSKRALSARSRISIVDRLPDNAR